MITEKELKEIKSAVRKVTYMEDALFTLKEYFGSKRTKSKSSSGGYANVFIPADKNYVIKMINKGENDSYVEYARFCINHHDKFPNLPKIYSMFSTPYIQYFVIEKLKHDTRKANKFIAEYLETDRHGSLIVSKFNPLYPIMRKIRQIIDKNPYATEDLDHNRNIMIRTCGTAVITDPIAD